MCNTANSFCIYFLFQKIRSPPSPHTHTHASRRRDGLSYPPQSSQRTSRLRNARITKIGLWRPLPPPPGPAPPAAHRGLSFLPSRHPGGAGRGLPTRRRPAAMAIRKAVAQRGKRQPSQTARSQQWQRYSKALAFNSYLSKRHFIRSSCSSSRASRVAYFRSFA